MHSQDLTVLAKLSYCYHVVPATSTPEERIFNICGHIFNPDWYWLTDKTFEGLMNIEINGLLSFEAYVCL